MSFIFMCSFFYLISRSIMPDYFPFKPMDIEGEAECAIVIQTVTAEGEKGVGIDLKRTSIHPEVNFWTRTRESSKTTWKSRGERKTSCCLDCTAWKYPWGRVQGRNPHGDPLLNVGEGVSDLLWVWVCRAQMLLSSANVRRIATYSAWRRQNWTHLKPAEPENEPFPIIH